MPTPTDDRSLWEYASARGLNRRHFLRLLLAGGATAVLAACADLGSPDGIGGSPSSPAADPAPTTPWFKDPAPFIVRGDKGLEARLENMQGAITPNRLFFVRNNSVSLDLDPVDWRLAVAGDAVSEPLELTYADIRSLPSRALTSYLECAGNHRAMFGVMNGQEASGTQWMTGAVSNGEWVGAQLRDVLTLAGIRPDAVSVLLVGLDVESPEDGFRYVLPVEKAMDPDTLLAYTLNGETLPKDHGFPVRALVPGWVGSANVKWLGRIVVSSEPMWTRNNTTSYTLIGDAYPPQGESLGQPVTMQVIKSALAGRTSGGTPSHPRVRALTRGAYLTRGMERRLRSNLARGHSFRIPTRPRLGAVRVPMGRGTGRLRRHDARNGCGRQYPTRPRAVQ